MWWVDNDVELLVSSSPDEEWQRASKQTTKASLKTSGHSLI